MTEDTSDDTHLADDSKRQENAAGYSGSASPVQAAEATEGTSDDTHLADDSKRPLHGIHNASVLLAAELPEIRDPNRGRQMRLDYVFENLEGVRCQLYPGDKGKDATPIFRQV